MEIGKFTYVHGLVRWSGELCLREEILYRRE